jgi:hypothetical protein
MSTLPSNARVPFHLHIIPSDYEDDIRYVSSMPACTAAKKSCLVARLCLRLKGLLTFNISPARIRKGQHNIPPRQHTYENCCQGFLVLRGGFCLIHVRLSVRLVLTHGTFQQESKRRNSMTPYSRCKHMGVYLDLYYQRCSHDPPKGTSC